LSRFTQAAAAAALLVFSTGAAMAACPPPVLTGNVTGAPVWSHTGLASLVFKVDGDSNLYGMPIDAVLDSNGNVVSGKLEPGTCMPPMKGRVVMANQIDALVTANQFIQELNAALHTKMPLLTIGFDVTTYTLDSPDDGTAFVVYDHDQPSETMP
jgi:hypothetical protein